MCMVNGLLELWSFDEMQISSLTKEDILRKINQPTLIRYVLISTLDRELFSIFIPCYPYIISLQT